MNEFLFIVGGSLRIAQTHLSKAKSPPWILAILAGGLIVQFGIFPFLASELKEGIVMCGMVAAGLWILGSGLLSTQGAPTWHTVRLLGFFVLTSSILYYEAVPIAWRITSIAGVLLGAVGLLWRPLLLRAALYGWSLMHIVVLEVIYLLPHMEKMELSGVDALLVGSLFISLGTAGFFGIKYCTMCVATLLRGQKEYTDLLAIWLQKHFPENAAWRADLILLSAAALAGLLGMNNVIPAQTGLYIALALLVFPR